MLTAALLSLAIGVSLGLLGGGGSILTLPILVYVVGLEIKSAIATSLLVVGATSLAAMVAHARAGRVRWRVGASFGAASVVGAFAGGHVAHVVPGQLLLAGFTALMAITGLVMLRRRTDDTARTAPGPGRTARTSMLGAGVGALTGMVGAGGGFAIVPALAMLCGLGIAEAVGTSLLVIALNSLAGFAGHLGHVAIDVRVAFIVTAAAVVGSLGGASLASRASPAVLRRGFAVLVLAMAATMTYRQLPAEIRSHLIS